MLSSVTLAVLLVFLRMTVQGPHSTLRHAASLWDSEAERNFSTCSAGFPSIPSLACMDRVLSFWRAPPLLCSNVRL